VKNIDSKSALLTRTKIVYRIFCTERVFRGTVKDKGSDHVHDSEVPRLESRLRNVFENIFKDACKVALAQNNFIKLLLRDKYFYKYLFLTEIFSILRNISSTIEYFLARENILSTDRIISCVQKYFFGSNFLCRSV